MGRSRAERSRLEAWRAFLVAHALLVRRLDHELREEVGIPLAWYDVLFTLSDAGNGGRLRMRDLAERVLITRSNCTRLVDRMARHGLVRREADPQDRRGVVAVLTDEGRSMLRGAARVHLRGVTEHWAAQVSREDAARLEQVFGDIVAALRRRPAPPGDPHLE